jgi:hypothetical protein
VTTSLPPSFRLSEDGELEDEMAQNHEEERRKQSCRPAAIEPAKFHRFPYPELLEQDVGDEETRQNKEHCHPVGARSEDVEREVEGENEEDGDAAQPIQTWPALPGCLGDLRSGGVLHEVLPIIIEPFRLPLNGLALLNSVAI